MGKSPEKINRKRLREAAKESGAGGEALPFARACEACASALTLQAPVKLAFAADLSAMAAGYNRWSIPANKLIPSLTASAEYSGRPLVVCFQWAKTQGGDWGANVMMPAGMGLIDPCTNNGCAAALPCFILTVWGRTSMQGSARGHFWSVSERAGKRSAAIIPDGWGAAHQRMAGVQGTKAGRSLYRSGYADTVEAGRELCERVVVEVMQAIEAAGLYRKAAAARLKAIGGGVDSGGEVVKSRAWLESD